jgi:hypothetical protein
MIFAVVTSVSLVRRHAYETFVRIHQALAAIVVVGIWLHLPGKPFEIPTLYLFTATCLWASLRLLRLLLIVFRSRRIGEASSCAVVWSLPNAFQVHIWVARPWEYHAGQYVYLRLRPGFHESMQSHPYFVSWWYKDHLERDVVVLVISRQRGFSNYLATHSSGDLVLGKEEDNRLILATDGINYGKSIKADIEGPYGKEIGIGEYGKVLLFATESGIAGVFPFIKQLLDGYNNWNVKARKLALFWEVESDRGSTYQDAESRA